MKDTSKIEYLVSLFFAVGRIIREKSPDAAVDPMSMLRLETLRYIQSETPTMKAIAIYLNVTAPSATSLIQGMVRAGYITRYSNPSDKRVSQMKITPKGALFLKNGFKQITKKSVETFSKLKPQQIDNLITVMKEIKSAYK